MSELDVKRGLIQAVQAFLASQSVTDVAWENVTFDPTGTGVWARVTHIPAAPFVVTLGGQGFDRTTGFVQVDLLGAINRGAGQLDDIAEAARQEFVAGKTYTYNGQETIITQCFPRNAFAVDNWYRKTLEIYFRADIQRAAIS